MWEDSISVRVGANVRLTWDQQAEISKHLRDIGAIAGTSVICTGARFQRTTTQNGAQ